MRGAAMKAVASSPSRPTPSRIGLVATGAAALGLGLLLLFSFNPADGGFFPRCAFHTLSGLNCPGCGGQRALHHLLHGNFAAALRSNALLLALLPLAGWQLVAAVRRRRDDRRAPGWFQHHLWAWALATTVIGFGVVRNLPGFEWLRP